MGLKGNLEYWKISLENPEPLIDDYYKFDNVIVEDKELIQKVNKLRGLIISYCIVLEKDKKMVEILLDEIYKILTSTDKIKYTEFVAFWKVLDMSFSVFIELPNSKDILSKLLEEYCYRRGQLYDNLGYSNITVQALYDSGVSREKGTAGITKVLYLTREILRLDKHLRNIGEVMKFGGYFLPDKEDKELFDLFCKEFRIHYEFGTSHQGKKPDVVLKVDNHFLIIEAKHIKESGGAQDKQISEIIDFIRYSEDSDFIHYISFMDGTYFNAFIELPSKDSSKVNRQKKDIEKYLKENPRNFFVNTSGLKKIFENLREVKNE
jgi:hypothetical protein